jgi:soluble lytic murein transglycosylase
MRAKTAKIIASAIIFLLVAWPVSADSIPGGIPGDLQEAFSRRQWDILDAAANKEGATLSVKDQVLYGNALWFRGDYGKGLDIFRAVENDVPAGILPYLRMRIVLGLERTGRPEEALQEAMALGDGKDWILAPYVQYAIGRLARETGKMELAVEAFKSMTHLARDEKQRKTSLEALFDLSAAGIEEARMLLEIEPRNMEALMLLEETGPPFISGDALYLAEAALNEQRPEKALEFLENTRFEKPDQKDRATYLTAKARMFLGKKKEAADMLYHLGMSAETDPDEAVRAVSLLKEMAKESKGEYEKGLLAAIADSGPSRTAALSMNALAGINRRNGNQKRQRYWENRLLDTYPASTLVVPICWERGWEAWKNDSPETAARHWKAAFKARLGERDEAKILFWLRRALKDIGEETKELSRQLRDKHPLDFYTFAAFPNQALPLSEEKTSLLEQECHELETWGFMIYARMHLLEKGTPAALYRAALITQWLGDPHGSYLYGHAIFRAIPKAGGLPPEVVEILFPRPYEEEVRKVSERVGVPVYDIWALMRRESAFNPMAVSHVGAMGLMQLMPPTARENARMLGLEEEKTGDFFKPDINILLGAHHFRRMQNMFERVEQAVAAYNAGQGRVRSWLKNKDDGTDWVEWVENIPYDETREFVRQVMANRNVYIHLEEKQAEH